MRQRNKNKVRVCRTRCGVARRPTSGKSLAPAERARWYASHNTHTHTVHTSNRTSQSSRPFIIGRPLSSLFGARTHPKRQAQSSTHLARRRASPPVQREPQAARVGSDQSIQGLGPMVRSVRGFATGRRCYRKASHAAVARRLARSSLTPTSSLAKNNTKSRPRSGRAAPSATPEKAARKAAPASRGRGRPPAPRPLPPSCCRARWRGGSCARCSSSSVEFPSLPSPSLLSSKTF